MKRKLRIAQIAPLVERVPPKKYGGTERVVSALTEELVKRGHDVTLFATRDSITNAKLDAIYPRGLREAKLSTSQRMEWSMMHIGRVYNMSDSFDIIHDHNTTFAMPMANLVSTPTVMTIHGTIRPSNRRLFENFTNPYFVSISKDQIKHEHQLKNVITIPNGLDLTNSPFKNKNKGYLLFVGRISMIKGVHFAIDVAQELNLPLIIAAKLDSVDLPYFKEYIEPRLDERIRWIGEVSSKERNKLMSEAICLLNPISWREPFGLTMIEAMACGSPVVAFNKGSIPEVIIDKKTGYIVEDIEDMIEAVKNIDKINKKDCRTHALKNFNEKLMTDRYEALYHHLIAKKEDKIIKNKEYLVNIPGIYERSFDNF